MPEMTSPIARQIEDAQARLTAARDDLTQYLSNPTEQQDSAERDALTTNVVALENDLASLERAERAALPRIPAQQQAATTVVTGELPARPRAGPRLTKDQLAMLPIRAAVCFCQAKQVGHSDPFQIANLRYGHSDATKAYLNYVVQRAAVSGALTSVPAWAGELVEEAQGAWLETLTPESVMLRLRNLGIALNFGPGRGSIRLPYRAATPSISGSFVAEGSPIPVRRLGLTSTLLTPHKMGVITVFSREMAAYSNPAIEQLLRAEILSDTTITIDTLGFDNVAGSATRPAGLLNGVTPLTASTAGGYAAFLEDIMTLTAPFDAANAGRRLVLIMNTAQRRQISMAPGPDGTFGWADRFLGEFTVLSSTTIPAGTVILIDAVDFASAIADAPEYDVSEQAVLHMEDSNPQQISAAGTPNVVAAPVQSMFQTAMLALRMLWDVTWAMRRANMVQYMTGVSWLPDTTP